MGTAHFWNQTIDTVLAIQLIVGIGLAIDYSAHIGHCFMTVTGSKNGELTKFETFRVIRKSLIC